MTALPRIMVAPNGARRTKADHPQLPMTLPEVVATTQACAAAGADGLHLHLRDDDGAHILDAGLYAEALAELDRQMPGFYVQITTEAVGRYTPAAQRALLQQITPVGASVALREVLDDGDITATRDTFADCRARGIDLQLILYDQDDLKICDNFGLQPDDYKYLFVLGRYSAGQQSAPSDLAPFLQWLGGKPDPLDWAICAFGRAEIDCLLAAHDAGGKMRIGFENAIHRADGTLARDNAERVSTLRAALSAHTPAR